LNVKHFDDGELRRMLDEPEQFGIEERNHANTCEICSARGARVASAARSAEQVFRGDVTPPDATAAYLRIRDSLAAPARFSLNWRLVSASALAAAFIAALFFTPLGGYARSFLTIFEPRQFQPIEISRADLRELHLLPQANDVGTQRVVRKPKRQNYDSFDAARRHVAFTVLHPATLPQHFGTVRTYSTIAPGEMTFTFSAAKARAFERRSHKALPPMPPSLDGTVVRLQTGQVFNAHYEASSAKPQTGTRRRGTPFFELIEAQAPRITSTGASLDTLEQYLLAMPNVSPQLAAQIRALSDIQNTVPVPVEIDKQTARRVTVNGAQGLAIGDNTGLGAGVMWEKDGIIYVVGGPLSMDDVMTVANGLR
jgi:hypothetical protein